MNKVKKNKSFQSHIIMLVLTITLPLILIITIFNIYTVKKANQRVYESSINTINLYKNSLESDLKNLESLMVSLVASDPSYSQLKYSQSSFKKYSNIYNVISKYQNFMSTYSIVGAMHLYSKINDIYRTEYQGTYDYYLKQDLSNVIYKLLDSQHNPTQKGWFYILIDENAFLIRIIGKDGLFTVCIVDMERVPVPQSLNQYNLMDGFIVYGTENAIPVILNDFLDTGKIESDTSNFLKLSNGNSYILTNVFSQYASTNIYYFHYTDGIFGILDMVQICLLFFSILLSMLLPSILIFMYKQSFKPMKYIISTMEKIKDGQIDIKMDTNHKILEYKKLSLTFNDLMEQIKNLKIESYETEISEQKTRFLLLQSQIRPHFYLNCLKNIQALTYQKQYEKIHILVLNLSEYLRFLFRDGCSMVSLQKELCSIKSYIKLQEISIANTPQCVIEVDNSLNNIEIPPLSLLTFVENSIKHANLPNTQLIIRIKAVLLNSQDGTYLNLTITDNGPGFTQEILDILNSQAIDYNPEHIGIPNVKKRLELLYKDKSSIYFSNIINGSCIEIFIPLNK